MPKRASGRNGAGARDEHEQKKSCGANHLDRNQQRVEGRRQATPCTA